MMERWPAGAMIWSRLGLNLICSSIALTLLPSVLITIGTWKVEPAVKEPVRGEKETVAFCRRVLTSTLITGWASAASETVKTPINSKSAPRILIEVCIENSTKYTARNQCRCGEGGNFSPYGSSKPCGFSARFAPENACKVFESL